MRALVVGCGYAGMTVAAELVRQGHQVFGVRLSAKGAEELSAAGINPVIADIAEPESLSTLSLPFDWVVNTTASTKGGSVEDYRRIYLSGTKNLLDILRAAPPKKFVYTSSTGVYAQDDGGQVSETSPAQPSAATAQVLLETENLLLQAAQTEHFPAVILRVSGIYGPERSHYLSQYLAGCAVIAGQGDRFVNMIHRDDLAAAIIAALKNGRGGEIYNVSDDEPVRQIHLYRWLSEALGRAMPRFVPETPEARKRAASSKRVSNRKLKMELGVQLKYPNFRAGLTAEIQRLDL